MEGKIPKIKNSCRYTVILNPLKFKIIIIIVSLFQVRCMKLVQHPNVVRLYEVIDTNSKLYLILELGDGGDLYDYIMKHDAGN